MLFSMYATFKVCFIIFLIPLSLCQEDEEYNNCRPIYTHNYGYKIYFHLPESAIFGNDTIIFPFSVQTSSDAHILFTTTASPKDSDPVYEVVLGAGWNSYSEIRRLHLFPSRTSRISRGILNKEALKKFWVKIENGEISLGKDQSTSPVTNWKDGRPLKINYISFSSWHGTSAKWYFDCRGITPITQNKTATEKLKSDLFAKYDPYTIPNNDYSSLDVYSNISIHYVNLDPVTSSLEIIGILESSWEDESLKWLPSSYDNITFIRITDHTIWQPAFLLLNGATLNQKWFHQGLVIVNHDGSVEWSSPIHLITRCNIEMFDWPRDHHVCTVFIGLYSDQQSVQLDGFKDINLSNGNSAGIWEITSVEGDTDYITPPWEEALDPNATDSESSPVLTLEISLQRHSSVYYYVLYIPLKVTVSVSIISFCLPYSCPQRLIVQVIALIIFSINLISIDSLLPPVIKETPLIISLSSGLLMVATVFTIPTVWLIQCSRSNQPKSIPFIFDKLINFLSTQFNLFTSSGTRKLLVHDDEEDEHSMKLKKEMNLKQKWKAYLTFVDYLLLFLVVIAYLTLLLVHKEIP